MTPQGIDALRDVVQRRVEVEGLRKLANRLQGIEVGQIRSVNDGRDPKGSTVEALCRALGLEFYIGSPRNELATLGSPRLGGIEESARQLVSAVLAAGGNPFPADLQDEAVVSLVAANVNEAPPGTRPVDVVEFAAAAGGGTQGDTERVRGLVWFARYWLDRHGLDPTRCAIIRVRGESMEPTLPDGCAILIDRNRRTRRERRIYVVRTNGGLIVKRAAKHGRAWELTSDNPAGGAEPWSPDTETIGEVVWMARTLIDPAQ